MLDDRGGTLFELRRQFPGRIQVEKIVIGKFLALELSCRNDVPGPDPALAVKRRRLMRVLAVAKLLDFLERRLKDGRKSRLRAQVFRKIFRDQRVVARGHGEGVAAQPEAGLPGQGAAVFPHFPEDGFVIPRADHHGHVVEVLGRRPDHGGAADIDVFHGVLQGTARLRDSRLEGI